MARPEKKGLQSFAFDVDFFADPKIETIAAEFGIKGEIVAVKLLCAIYRNGYFIEWGDNYRTSLLRNLPGISSGLLDTIVQRLVKCGLFDSNIFYSTQVLTSQGIQRRYFSEVRRRRLSRNMPYLLVGQYSDFVDPPENPNLHPASAPVAASDHVPTQPSPNPAPCSVTQAQTQAPSTDISHVQGILTDIQRPTLLRDNLCIRFHLSTDELVHRFAQFQMDCQCREIQHTDRQDALRHFFSWLCKQPATNQTPTSYSHTQHEPTTPRTDNKRRGIEPIPPDQADYTGSF